MKKILFYLFTGVSCFAGPLTVGNIPQVFTPTSLTNSPVSASGNNINVVGTIVSGGLSFSGSLNGISAATIGFISNLSSDAQTQITANSGNVTTLTSGLSTISNRVETVNNGLTTTSNSLVMVGNGLVITSNRVETLNTAALAGLTAVSNGLTITSNLLTTVGNGLITTSNRVETVNGLNVKLSGDTMTGPLKVTALTNSALTASQFVFSDPNKALTSVAIGTGITNNSGILSNNIVAGSNITITSGANGQLSIASTSGGSTPTGTGFTHITGGVQDGASKIVDVSSSDITGILAAARFPSLTGDITTSSGAVATTLKNTGTAGTYTKSTFDAQGREISGTSAILASSDYVNQGTTTTLLHGNAAGNPSFGQVSLTADVTGVLPIANFTTGTPTGGKFVRDDGVLAIPAGGGVATTIYSGDSSLAGNRFVNGAAFDLTFTNIGTVKFRPTFMDLANVGSNFLSSEALHSQYIGNNAGFFSGAGSSYNVFIGDSAGFGDTSVIESVFLGEGSGNLAIAAERSVFIGADTGRDAINSDSSVFIGVNAGYGATVAPTAVMIGANSGTSASGAIGTVFLGSESGHLATNAQYSFFGGYQAGRTMTNASKSIFLGPYSGTNRANTLWCDTQSMVYDGTYQPLIYGEFDNRRLQFNGSLSVTGAVKTGTWIVSKTSNYTITAGDCGTLFNNIGAGGTVNFTLPTASVGLNYEFVIADAQALTITAGASTTIRIASTASASAGNITSSAIGNTIRLQATSTTTWVAMFHEGTWTVY